MESVISSAGAFCCLPAKDNKKQQQLMTTKTMSADFQKLAETEANQQSTETALCAAVLQFRGFDYDEAPRRRFPLSTTP